MYQLIRIGKQPSTHAHHLEADDLLNQQLVELAKRGTILKVETDGPKWIYPVIIHLEAHTLEYRLLVRRTQAERLTAIQAELTARGYSLDEDSDEGFETCEFAADETWAQASYAALRSKGHTVKEASFDFEEPVRTGAASYHVLNMLVHCPATSEPLSTKELNKLLEGPADLYFSDTHTELQRTAEWLEKAAGQLNQDPAHDQSEEVAKLKKAAMLATEAANEIVDFQ